MDSTRAAMFKSDLSRPCNPRKQWVETNRPAPPSMAATSVQLNHESQNMYLHNLTAQHGGVNQHLHCRCEVFWSVLESYLPMGWCTMTITICRLFASSSLGRFFIVYNLKWHFNFLKTYIIILIEMYTCEMFQWVRLKLALKVVGIHGVVAENRAAGEEKMHRMYSELRRMWLMTIMIHHWSKWCEP